MNEHISPAEQRLLARLANLGDPEPPRDLVDSVMREVTLRRVGPRREIALVLSVAVLVLAALACTVPPAPVAAELAAALSRLALAAKIAATVAGAFLWGPFAVAFGLLLLGLALTLAGLGRVTR